MTNAKDTFYIMLRDRLAALNPSRTVVVRGVTRPGVLVDENELATVATLTDVFRLQWTAMTVDAAGPLPLATLHCEIHYATAGTAGNGGMDRGRLLTMMDSELAAALGGTPTNAVKLSYANAASGPVKLATRIFWGGLTYAAAQSSRELVERTATLEVFGYQEVGE